MGDNRALFSDMHGKKQQQKSQMMFHGFTMVAVKGYIFMKREAYVLKPCCLPSRFRLSLSRVKAFRGK